MHFAHFIQFIQTPSLSAPALHYVTVPGRHYAYASASAGTQITGTIVAWLF